MPTGTRTTCLAALALVAAIAAPANQAAEASPEYRLEAEVAVKGVVDNVVQHAGWMGWDGVYATLRTHQGEVVQAQFAPAAFLKMLDLMPKAGDSLEIRGVIADTPEGRVLLVRELRRANVVISLRDPKGHPVW
jgi:tagatose-1,6-bisphosphate aldolase non-catalytic subunit AgaZ/GatZ